MQDAHQGTIQSLRISPDGKRLASCGDDGAIMIWDLASAERLQTLRRDRPYERLNITGIRGLTEVQKGTLQKLGAVDDTALTVKKGKGLQNIKIY
jgi:WD40 repeat protein